MKNFLNCRWATGTTVIAIALQVGLAVCLAASVQAADISVSNATAQIRDDTVNGRRIEVYMSIENGSGAADRLYSVRSKVSRKTMISVVQGGGHGQSGAGHAMAGQSGMAQHMQTSVLDLPAGETVVLKRGSSHIMLMEPETMPVEGDTIPLTLFFERGGRISVEATVTPMQMQMGH